MTQKLRREVSPCVKEVVGSSRNLPMYDEFLNVAEGQKLCVAMDSEIIHIRKIWGQLQARPMSKLVDLRKVANVE